MFLIMLYNTAEIWRDKSNKSKLLWWKKTNKYLGC